MPALWDRYLDVADAAPLLHALAVLERYRAVREPLPLHNLDELLSRLRTIAGIARDEAVHWRFEAGERELEASVDGGRWGSVETARMMAAVAEELANGSQLIFEAAHEAAQDLAPRLGLATSEAVRSAERATTLDIERLLDRAREW